MNHEPLPAQGPVDVNVMPLGKEECAGCGTLLNIHGCLNCGAPVCCPRCCNQEIDEALRLAVERAREQLGNGDNYPAFRKLLAFADATLNRARCFDEERLGRMSYAMHIASGRHIGIDSCRMLLDSALEA